MLESKPDNNAPSGLSRAPNVVTQDGITFGQIDPSHLDRRKEILAVPQALDNQWASKPRMEEIYDGIRPREDIEGEIRREARREYVNALLSSNRVIVNRAFCVNSAAITCDYSDPEGRRAFQSLLSKGVVVPFLFNENSLATAPAFDVKDRLFEQWKEIAKDSQPLALRLDWDDAANKRRITQDFSRRFSNNCRNMASLAIGPLLDSLDLPANDSTAIQEFRKRRVEFDRFVSDFVHREEFVSRNDIYKHFVCADGENISNNVYDFKKPFARELKQLVDLTYNTSLPDALGGQLITPAGTINRSALQEVSSATGAAMNPQQLMDIIGSIVVDDVLNAVGGQTAHFMMEQLHLRDVIHARNMDEWAAYNHALQRTATTDYLSGDGPSLFRSNLELSAAAHHKFFHKLLDHLVTDELRPYAPVAVEAGLMGLHVIGHIGGQEAFVFSLEQSGKSHFEFLAEHALERMPLGAKQCVLSVAFSVMRKDAPSKGRTGALASANLVKLDLLSRRMHVTQEAIEYMFAKAGEIAQKAKVPFTTTADVEATPSSSIAADPEQEDA